METRTQTRAQNASQQAGLRLGTPLSRYADFQPNRPQQLSLIFFFPFSIVLMHGVVYLTWLKLEAWTYKHILLIIPQMRHAHRIEIGKHK